MISMCHTNCVYSELHIDHRPVHCSNAAAGLVGIRAVINKPSLLMLVCSTEPVALLESVSLLTAGGRRSLHSHCWKQTCRENRAPGTCASWPCTSGDHAHICYRVDFSHLLFQLHTIINVQA